MTTGVHVVGVGMVPFTKPGKSASYSEMGEQAARAALADAGVDYTQIQQAYVGYVYGDSTSGQSALYGLGQTGIPIVNVNNNCSTGSSALWLARQAVANGAVDCALAVGFEQMVPGALANVFADRPSAMARFETARDELQAFDPQAPLGAPFFGGAGQAYVDEFGIDPAVFAEISVKARKHAANNPNAVFRDPVTVEQVLTSPKIYGPLTRLQCCPPTCGAAAAVVCSPEFARRHSLQTDVVIAAQSLTTDPLPHSPARTCAK
jgi:sterol carrier protein 2